MVASFQHFGWHWRCKGKGCKDHSEDWTFNGACRVESPDFDSVHATEIDDGEACDFKEAD